MTRLGQVLVFVAVVAAVLAIAACGDSGSTDEEPRGAATTGEVNGDFAAEGVTLDVSQQGTTCGPEGAYVAEVSWAVPEDVPFVRITVGDDDRLFTEGRGPAGTALTERWVRPGLLFTLTVTGESGEVLARTRADAGECTD